MSTCEKLFLLWACAASLLAILMAAAVVVMLLPRVPTTKVLGDPGEYPISSVTRLAFEGQISPADPRKMSSSRIVVWLVHDANPVDTYRVLFAADPHSGCIIGWNEELQRFEDPCHGSKYTRQGKYIEGPAPRDLDYFPVRTDKGPITIDLHLIPGKPHD